VSDFFKSGFRHLAFFRILTHRDLHKSGAKS
jgi:hypothetical protein